MEKAPGKFVGDTSCEKLPINLCGDMSCRMVPGDEECHNKVGGKTRYGSLVILLCFVADYSLCDGHA